MGYVVGHAIEHTSRHVFGWSFARRYAFVEYQSMST